MAETRRDRRAPLSLKVRFKSATVDEFIEQYAADISRGGLFIKSKSPMAVGTLLKFEFQLQDQSRIIHGVGRVVWKREVPDAEAGCPPGMGIKFIKMDADSRVLVDTIVSRRGGAEGQFEAGKDPRKRPPSKPTAPLFPVAASTPADLPLPEDSTQVRHASEFLAEALLGGGAGEAASAEATAEAEEARRRTDEIQREREQAADQEESDEAERMRAERQARLRAVADAVQADLEPAVAPEEPREGILPDSEPEGEREDLEPTVARPMSDELRAELGLEPAAAPAGRPADTEESGIDALLDEAVAQAESETRAAEVAVREGVEQESRQAEVAAGLLGSAEGEGGEKKPVVVASVPSSGAGPRPSSPASTSERGGRSLGLPIVLGLVAVLALSYFGARAFTRHDDSDVAADVPHTGRSPSAPGAAAQPTPPPRDPTGETGPQAPTVHVQEAQPNGPPIPDEDAVTMPVRVVSVPDGAAVFVDGEARGVAPIEVALPVGREVVLTLSLEGYVEAMQPLTVEEGQGPVRVRLEARPFVVAVQTTPADARAVAGGRRVGPSGEVTLSAPPSGPIHVTATKAGFSRATATVEPTQFVLDGERMVATIALALEERARHTTTSMASMTSTTSMATTMAGAATAHGTPGPSEPSGGQAHATMEAPPPTMQTPPPTMQTPPPTMQTPPPTMAPAVPDNPF